MKNHRSFWCVCRKDDKVRKNIWNKIKQNKAFSLMETLLVVAIMGILVGVSVPAVVKIKEQLSSVEYDDYAETIFMEAQNQLMEMRGDGSIQSLKESGVQVSGDVGYGGTLHYFDKLTAEAMGIIATFGGDNTAFQLTGNYIIECNRETGEVYSVFYWENGAEVGSFYANSSQYRTDKKQRAADKVGYYGGENAAVKVIAPTELLKQEVELVNGEELYLKISYEKGSEILKDITTIDKLSIQCTITGEGAGSPWTVEIPKNQYTNTLDTVEFYYLLDSMQSGKDFASITSGLVSGDNLTIEIKGMYEDSNGIYATDIDVVRGNSLFADKSNDGSVVKISTLRHLKNLNTYTNTVSKVNIIQTADIDFNNNNYVWNGDTYVGLEDAGTSKRPNSLEGGFTAISNDSLFVRGDNSESTTIDGSGYRLKNFVINGSGLFSVTKRTDFKNIRIEDVTVNGANNTGALVGEISNGKISNCGVYLTTYTVGNNDEKQYYVDRVSSEGDYANEMERRIATYVIFGDINVGGLAGTATNVKIDKSFAAVRVGKTTSTNVGGVVGNISGSEVKNSYSSGDIYASSTAGGFAGTSQTTKMYTSYTTSNLYAGSTAGGFAGSIDGGAYEYCYSYGEVLNPAGTAAPTSAGGFVVNTNDSTFKECAYLVMDNYNAGLDGAVTAKGYDGLKASASESIGMNASYPYDGTLLNDEFPFPHRTGTHYGNWPVNAQTLSDTALVYYERYDNGDDTSTYGFYCEAKLAAPGMDDYVWVLDTLRDEACVEDGYALLSTYDLQNFSYKLNDSGEDQSVSIVESMAEAESGKAVKMGTQAVLEFKGYKGTSRSQQEAPTYSARNMYLYQLPSELQNTRSNTTGFYDKLTLNNVCAKGSDTPVLTNVNIYYCPHFAKTAINPGVEVAAHPESVYVRSARQLNALGTNSFYWQLQSGTKLKFKQESDVNFVTYESELVNVPIGTITNRFLNDYDGQGYRIIDYSLSSAEQYVGLFGVIENATIENVVMTVSVPGKGTIESTFNGNNTNAIGALIGLANNTTSGEVKNCAAAGYLVEYNTNKDRKSQGIIMGGLIGASLSNVRDCAVVNDVSLSVEYPKDNQPHTFMGGLAGSHVQGVMERGYAGGTIVINSKGAIKKETTIALAGICPGYFPTTVSPTKVPFKATYNKLYSYVGITLQGDIKEVKINEKNGKEEGNAYIVGITGGYKIGANDVNTDVSNCGYLNLTACGAELDEGRELTLAELRAGTKVGLSDFVTSAPNEADQAADYTYPSSDFLVGDSYPYPTVITRPVFNVDGTVKDKEEWNHVHYGDWPGASAYTELPVYYELYQRTAAAPKGPGQQEENIYRVCAIYPEGEIYNYLLTDASEYKITKAGYGYLKYGSSAEAGSMFAYKMGGNTYYFHEENLVDTKVEKTNYEMTHKYVKVDPKNNDAILSTSEETLYVNPKFAAAFSDKDNLGTEENPFQVRTWTQFTNMNSNNKPFVCYAEQTYSIAQEGDQFTPISIGETGHYDGGAEKGYEITGVKKNLFNENNGMIQNCSVSGAKIELKKADIKDLSGVAGFVTVNNNNGKITNCNLIDCSINAELDKNNILSIAGFVNENKGLIDSCGVYATKGYENAKIEGCEAYGFVGTNSGTISKCMVVAKIKVAKINGGGNNLPAVMIAGFAGSNAGSITFSYANCEVEINEKSGNDSKAAGFVIHSTGGNVSNCYSAGKIKVDGKAAESVTVYGFGEEVIAQNCYALVNLAEAKGTSYGFAKKVLDGSVDGDDMHLYWVKDAKWHNAIDGIKDDEDNKAKAKSLRELMSVEDYAEFTGSDYPYDGQLKVSSDYPYPSVGIPHYGNWPVLGTLKHLNEESKVKNAGVFYYEKYGDQYGIYAEGIETTKHDSKIVKLIDTLESVDGLVPDEKGYGVFYCNGSVWEIETDNDNYVSIETYTSGKTEISEPAGLNSLGVPKEYKFYITDENVGTVSESYEQVIREIVGQNRYNEFDFTITKDELGRQ